MRFVHKSIKLVIGRALKSRYLAGELKAGVLAEVSQLDFLRSTIDLSKKIADIKVSSLRTGLENLNHERG